MPWIVHAPPVRNRVLRRGEIAEGLAPLPAGRVAGEARAIVAAARPEVAVLAMPHPAPACVCTRPAVPLRIATTPAEAARVFAAG